MTTSIKGALWLPFLCLLTLFFPAVSRGDTADRASEAARELHIAADPTWLALLHYAHGRCYVNDPSFLLSAPTCDPASEVDALLRLLLSADQDEALSAACRFPARAAFLSSKLTPLGFTLPKAECQEFLEYKQRAPADRISLVFASENILHPMSMMGHVFLKLEGHSDDGTTLEHAATFFTQITSINPLIVLADSFFLGMPSFFALTPYAEITSGYLEREKRSVWEYVLSASAFQRELIHAHIWELRYVHTPYYFIGYNCATVVYFIIAIAQPALLDQLHGWVTPIDVVRRAKADSVLADRIFIPSLDLRIRTYGAALGDAAASNVVDTLAHGSETEIRQLADGDVLRRKFAVALTERERIEPRHFPDHTEVAQRILIQTNTSTPAEHEFWENVKDPLSGPLSSRYTLGAVHMNGVGYGKLEFLPASHSLSDDNSRSFAESALELGGLSLLYNPDKGAPIIQNLSLYSYDSLVPYNPYVGGVSSRVSVGVEQQWDTNLAPFTAGHVTFGLGRTYGVGEDIRVYGLLNGSLNYGDKEATLSYYPELGATVYEIGSLKSVASYRFVCGEHSASNCYQRASLTESFIPNSTISPYIRVDAFWNGDTSAMMYEVGIKRYF